MPPSDNGAVLADVTSSMANATIRDAEASERSRNAGWVEPQSYDYETYNASTREEREANEQTRELPSWAANAVRYEWSDDYGDIGPAKQDLEDDLFGDEHKMQTGLEFNK